MKTFFALFCVAVCLCAYAGYREVEKEIAEARAANQLFVLSRQFSGNK